LKQYSRLVLHVLPVLMKHTLLLDSTLIPISLYFATGTGSIVSFIAASAGREPTVVGKPSSSPKEILEAVHGKFDCERTMMVGDRYA